ncbi:class I SAM-dependent methyltransferase [Janibacter melonis]|uniref:class I SAM-dependent methyltransferase n=1 Tax=Janibacter melonis TaxID=262209 RepID=UPI0020956F27|nr:class I SAM-dependent methyltransferase [Janibacter melonis]
MDEGTDDMSETTSGSDEVRAAYDAMAQAYAAAYPTTEPESAPELAMVDHLVELLGPGARVLDAGCGTGRMSRHLADRGAVVEGVDLSPGMLEQARAGHPDLPFSLRSLTDLGGEDGRHDGVLCWYSLIHLDDTDAVLAVREMARVVRPGGLVLVGFQTGSGVRDLGERMRARGLAVAHLPRWHREPDAVLSMLARAGLVEVAVMRRAPVGAEQDGQAAVLVRRGT